MSTQMVPMLSPEQREGSSRVALYSARCIYFGAFHLDIKKEELFKVGLRVKLQGKVYQMLAALLQKPEEVVTREELRSHLAPSPPYADFVPHTNPPTNILRTILGTPLTHP